ncbi:hypothetical protein KO361_04675 [Candidatus Woesearchaeota archaeon]|jgi:hypothetical protein|nr:hypothetical protein [Candidatus Woesearchaeota archaeon]
MLNNAFQTMTSKLESGPKPISQIADGDFNWKTAEKYLEILEKIDIVFSDDKGNKRLYYLYDRDNFFKIPVPEKTKQLIQDIFAKIKKFAPSVTKTQAHKILFELNQKFNLKIPMGWYLYGPVCLTQFRGNETEYNLLNKEQTLFLKETTQKYSVIDNFELENQIYKKTDNKLYLLKKSLKDFSFEDNVNIHMMDLIMLVPEETKELVTDYARSVMFLGWNHKTRELFNLVWKYIAVVNFKEDLKNNKYFDYDISIYFNKKIKECELEISNILDDLIISRGEQKHSQDILYQRWVKHKK